MNRHDKYVKRKCRVYVLPITVKSLRFLSYLEAKNLACQRFMDAGRTCKNPGPKTKKCLVIVIGIAEDLVFYFILFFFHQFPISQFLQSNVKASAHKGDGSTAQVP